MAKVFISSCDLQAPHAAALIRRLEEEDFKVIHSPLDLDGKLWGDVRYGGSCVKSLEGTDIFIVVITESWENSTSMKQELMEGVNCLNTGEVQRLYFYNPENRDIERFRHFHTIGMEPRLMLKERLPDKLDELVGVLKKRLA